MRELTLAEAQALECNGCGDCCDSRRAGNRWWWGSAEDDFYASLNGGQPLIIPLRETHEGEWEQSLPLPPPRGRVDAFTCAALRPAGDTASCSLYGSLRPEACSGFPLFGSFGAALELEAIEKGYGTPQTAWLPRCTWFDVLIVPDEITLPESL